MSFYDFQCELCNVVEEHNVPMSKRNSYIVVCKKCGNNMDRLLGNVNGIIFKGDGFYCNDYKKENK